MPQLSNLAVSVFPTPMQQQKLEYEAQIGQPFTLGVPSQFGYRWEVRDTTTGVTVASGPADKDQPMDEATAVEEARAALEAARNAEADRAAGLENPLALDTAEEIQAAVEELREPDPQAESALIPPPEDYEAPEQEAESALPV